MYLSKTGVYIPKHSISNDELVASYNAYADAYNHAHKDAIENEEVEALAHSTSAFIEKASGIKSRYVYEKNGILDINIMSPIIAPRILGEELSVMAEMGVEALQDALNANDLSAKQIDGVIVACSNFQRVYPAIAIEIQQALGIQGFGYDMNVACSAATFGIATAVGHIHAKLGKNIAIVNVEVPSAHLNYRNRDSHFIFGDVATAVIVGDTPFKDGYRIVDSKLITEFSANISNEFGFLERAESLATGVDLAHEMAQPKTNKLFRQEGRRVFKDVCPMVANLISEHLQACDINKAQVKKMWLHQANVNMIDLILRTVMGKDADKALAPIVIENFGNTSSASPMLAYHLAQDGMNKDDIGVLCSFGAGYSAGSVILQKI